MRRLTKTWIVHNMIAHPVAEVLWQLGFVGPANHVHNATVPAGFDHYMYG